MRRHFERGIVTETIDPLVDDGAAWKITRFGTLPATNVKKSGWSLASKAFYMALRELVIQHAKLPIHQWRMLALLVLRRGPDFDKQSNQTETSVFELASVLGYANSNSLNKALKPVRETAVLFWYEVANSRYRYSMEVGPLSNRKRLSRDESNKLVNALLGSLPLLEGTDNDDEDDDEEEKALNCMHEAVSILKLNLDVPRYREQFKQMVTTDVSTTPRRLFVRHDYNGPDGPPDPNPVLAHVVSQIEKRDRPMACILRQA